MGLYSLQQEFEACRGTLEHCMDFLAKARQKAEGKKNQMRAYPAVTKGHLNAQRRRHRPHFLTMKNCRNTQQKLQRRRGNTMKSLKVLESRLVLGKVDLLGCIELTEATSNDRKPSVKRKDRREKKWGESGSKKITVEESRRPEWTRRR